MNDDEHAGRIGTGSSVRTRRAVALGLCAFVCGVVLGIGRPQAACAADRAHPNVLLILTDDQGFGDVTSHGNKWIQTPIHDRIANEGARFDRFYVSPVCAPTRASLLTGRYHLRTGVHGVTRADETMRADEVTIAEILKANGYATGAFGKWHNGAHYPNHPNGQGFDDFIGFCAGHWNDYFDYQLEHNGEPIEFKGFIIDYLTDRALDFIDANKDRSWFCYLPLNTPHTPWQVPEKYWQRHKDQTDITIEARCAYAMCENIDDNMGRLLAKLDELKLTDDTIVLYLSDNGANSDRYNAGMKGRKGSLHEGGSRVPLFMRWPGHITPGTIVKPITMHIDLLPTLVEMTGVKHEQPSDKPLDGRSLVPLLNGKTDDWPHRTLFTHWGGTTGNRGAARTDEWRAVKYGKWELYDMIADPSQTKDVAKEHPDVVKQFTGEFDAWIADVTREGFDPIPADIGHPQAPLVTLPGHEAFLEPAQGKGISYGGRSGWANDYVTNWTDTHAYPRWPVRVVRGGKYEVTLLYRAPADSVGTKLRVQVGDASIDGEITTPHDPPHLTPHDRIERKEVYAYDWATLKLGVIELETGDAALTVHALNKPGAQVMHLKAVQFRRVN
ncbi:MAG: sulfatase-like hydrolase/transferase [Phycisphaera sp.]|nr:sulfatase-like hydrolase/transferase [Phycisphaera sp.]